MKKRAVQVRSALSELQDRLMSLVGLTARFALLLVPTCILLHATYENPERQYFLLIGTGLQAAICLMTFVRRSSWRMPIGPSIITLYLVGLVWLWIGDRREDSLAYLSKAILLVVPITFLSLQTLQESGAPAIRRAVLLSERLAARRDWPADLALCHGLPEVKALRAAIHFDASPALALLDHPRPEVRVAALAALEFRKEWFPGQAELVLQVAQRAEQPAIRAAAVTALGNIENRQLVEALAQFLHDTSLEVRRAAVEALMWDTERRWTWIRFAVRRILADPIFINDGPLVCDGQILTHEAVKDLTAWTAEKGVLSVRSAQTLYAHYCRALAEGCEPRLIEELRRLLGDPQTPAVLRLEFGKLLQQFHELTPPLLSRLLEPLNPAPLRLIACETILGEGDMTDPLRDQAMMTLKDLARLPNREISLSTADVIQRRLGVDLGLSLGQPLPPVQSRQAAEITRKVMQWATQYDEEENCFDSRPRARSL
jgi:hypothetical protein